MLGSMEIVAFIPPETAESAREFFEVTLGLRLSA